MNLLIKLGLICLVVVGSMYFSYHLNSVTKTVNQEEAGQEFVEKVPLYYDLDNPDKIYIYNEKEKRFEEVTIE